MLKKVAVFISGGGSNLQSLIDYNGEYEISLVISDRIKAKGLDRASNHNIKNLYIGKKNFPLKEERTKEVLKVLEEEKIDIIVLAGYLSIVDSLIIDKFRHKIINIHPSLIPSFCGMGYHGHLVHEAVYNSGVKITGATVHFVDEGVDSGEIIMQKTVDISSEDTPDEIALKVLKIEHTILPQALEKLASGKIKFDKRRTYIGD